MFSITITEKEGQELTALICKELGNPLVGRNERLIRKVFQKIQSSRFNVRLIGERDRSKNEIFIDKDGEPEARTSKCGKCGCIWRSWYVETCCPECNNE